MKLHLEATQHNITLRLLPDVRDNLHPLPSSPAQATATRAWVETQDSQTYNAPLIPVDPLRELDSFDALHYVITRLLGPGGCPWDVQQTHQSLRANLLEETYEVLETLDRSDMTALSEELGDLLMQVLVHSEMARQAGYFDIGDVLEQISTKLIRRHPHVFSDVPVADENEVLRNWEQIKAQERAHKGSEHRSALDGIPTGLPALAAAQKAGGRAARAGFDWPTLELIWGKVHEELAELIQAHEEHTAAQSDTSRAHLAEELGDTIYVVVQLARWLDLDAESVLREATSKFRRRFQAVEQAAREQDTSLHDLTLDQKLTLWRAAKDQ
jgi:tetrapyrrole methylase family protein/MazG family protein